MAFQCLKGADFLTELAAIEERVMVSINRELFRIQIRNFFYNDHGETLEQVAQRGGRCPSLGNIQGQTRQGSEKPDLGACCRVGWAR